VSLPQEDAKTPVFSRAVPAIAAAALAVVVFAVTLGGTYVYDDFDVFALDARLHHPDRWGQYWTQSYNGGVDNLYRPLVSMTYAAQWWLHGADELDAWKYHLVNLLLHAGVSALVAELARRLGGTRFGFTVGVLFAVHPIHVEAVANIVGRAELMCALGVVGALVLFLHRPMTTGRAFAIAVCFLLALLSKEQGMLTPLLLLFLGVAPRAFPPLPPGEGRGEGARAHREPLDPRRPPTLTLPPPMSTWEPRRERGPEARALAILTITLCFTLAGYIVFRESILKFWWDRNFLDWTINPLVRPDADRWLMPIVLLGRYASLLVFPWKLSPDYGARVIGWTAHASDPYLWIGVAAIGIWIIWFIIALRRRNAVATFALLALAVSYGLVSNFVMLIGTNFAERLMYLPSVFFLLLIGRLLCMLPRAALVPILAVLVILGSVRSVTYARRWNDRLSFYRISLREQPRSIRLYLLLTSEHLSRHELDEADRVAARACDELPEYWEVWVSRSTVAMEQGKFDDAQQYLDRAAQTRGAPLGRITGFMKRVQERRDAARRGASVSSRLRAGCNIA
jgi:hypothetical protein